MYTSIIFSHIFGIVFAILGISMFFNKKWTSAVIDDMMKNQGIIWLAGLFTVTMGASILILNRSWGHGLPLVISILGWLTLIKGTVILVFPNFTTSFYKKMNSGNMFVLGGFIVFILGILLLLQ